MSSQLVEIPQTVSLVRRSDVEVASPAALGAKGAELEITRLAGAIWSKLGYVLACAVLCAALGYGIARWQKPIYRSAATVELLGVNSDFLNLREVQPNASASPTGSADAYLQTEVELFGSKSLLERTLVKLGKLPESDLKQVNQQALVTRNNLLDVYAKRLRVEQVRESNLLQITYEDENPEFAAQFIDSLIAEAASRNVEDRWKSNDRLGVLFSKQVDLLRQRMENAEKELQDYGHKSGLLFTGENDSVAESRLTAIEQELSRAQAERMEKEARYRQSVAADPNSLPEVLSNEALRSYEAKLADLRRERAELAASMTPQNPRVLKIDAQIQDVAQTISRERRNVITGLANQYEAARKREALLTAASLEQAGTVSDLSEKAIHYNTLKREVETTRGLYEAMLRRMNDAQVMSTINASDIRMVDSARVPLKPAKPNKAVYAALGFLNGLLLPLTFLFVQEYRNRTIQGPNQTPSLFQVAELGVIPSAKSGGRVLDFPSDDAGRVALLAPKSDRGSVLQTHKGSHDLLKDSFRGIATSILFHNARSNKPLTLVVSSPHEGEGKTTTAFNLGLEMAAVGRKVLLIDGDFRRPTLHRFFSASNEAGLASLLAEKAPQIDPRTLVQETAVENLSLLAAGPSETLGTRWLQSGRLNTLLESLGRHYDLLLIDTAPILLMPETRIFAKAADGLLLVFRAGKTNYEDAMSACRRAAQDGTSILGTILNDWKPERSRYGYYVRRRA